MEFSRRQWRVCVILNNEIILDRREFRIVKITTTDLIDEVSSELQGMTKHDIKQVIDTYNKLLMEETADGSTVLIRGFGKFESKLSKPKRNLNLQTGKIEIVPPIRRPKFYPGKVFRDLTESR